MDVTTLALAVDSTQVTSASAALDKFAASGAKAEASASKFAAAGQKAATSWKEFKQLRLEPLKAELSNFGVPDDTLGKVALGQARMEFVAFRRGGVEAQQAVQAEMRKTAAEARALAIAMATAINDERAAGRGTPRVRPAGNTGEAAQLNAMAAAAAKAEANVEALGNTLSRSLQKGAAGAAAGNAVLDATAAQAARAAVAAANLEAAQVRLAAATARAADAQSRLNQVQRMGGLASPKALADAQLRAQSANAAVAQASARLQAARVGAAPNAMASAAAAPRRPTAQTAPAGGMPAWQRQQVAFQLNDFFVQVASGGAPMTALIQQGSQLSGTFGGVGNAFRAVTSLITPMRLAFGGAAASVGALALAMRSAESSARDLNTIQVQLAGQGKRGLFSNDDLRSFIEDLSQAPGITREVATAITSELSKAGQVGGEQFRELGRLAVDFARATGTEAPDAARQLAKALADPVRGAKALDEQFDNLFTSTQLIAIEGFVKLGDKAKAQGVILDALKGRLKGVAAEGMTPLQTATDELGNAWDRAMGRLQRSDGLRTMNALLAQSIGLVAKLIDGAGRIPDIGRVGVGNASVATVPSNAGPFVAAGNAAAGFFGRLFGRAKPTEPTQTTGDFARADRATLPVPQSASRQIAAAPSNQDKDRFIKDAREAGKAYRTEAAALDELRAKRDEQNKALKYAIELYGKNSAQAKEARAAIAGIDEQIAKAGKKGRTRVDREPDQIRREELAAELEGIQALFERERNALAFQNRFLQGEYQAGNISLRQYFAERVELIDKGVQDEVNALERRKQAIRADLDTPGKVKDPSERLGLQRQVDKLTADQGEVRARGEEQVRLSNQEASQSFKQLNEQVLAYRASLLQLQGDEIGAARIRTQIAIEQAKDMAARSKGTEFEITPQQVQQQERALNIQTEVQRITERSTTVMRQLQVEEERIAIAQRTGAVTTLTSLQQVSEARSRAVTTLEKEVVVMEQLAAQNRELADLGKEPINLRLQLDTEAARLELEKLKAELDPLKQQFDSLFKDAGTDFLSSLMEGKGLKNAFKSFGEMIAREINGVVARELSEQVFGENGIFKNAGGLLADIFGGEGRKKGGALPATAPVVDTTAVTASLSNLQTTADPAANALVRLQEAADSASFALEGATAHPVRNGDLDARPLPTGEQSVMDLFQEAERSADEYARSNALATTAVTQLANAAGKGNSALSLLPSIINAIQAAAAASSASSGSGGGIVGAIFNAFARRGGSMAAEAGLGYSKGGWTGNGDVDKPAGVVHGKEVVFSAPAVKTIGKEALLQIHEEAAKGKRPALFADPGTFHKSAWADDVDRYHTGGIVKSTAAAAGMKLKPNEVPAVLMGGPKGLREEVLTADDPRHRDNLTPKLAEVFAKAPRYHTGGLVGLESDSTRPALLPVERLRHLTRDERKDEAAHARMGGGGGETIIVNVTQPPGAARDTGMQFGAAAGKQLAHARRRNG
jgi:hypothetical protein